MAVEIDLKPTHEMLDAVIEYLYNKLYNIADNYDGPEDLDEDNESGEEAGTIEADGDDIKITGVPDDADICISSDYSFYYSGTYIYAPACYDHPDESEYRLHSVEHASLDNLYLEISWVDDIKDTSYNVVITPGIEKYIIDMVNRKLKKIVF